jgi:transcriptional regulator with XRE-family HTH domain
MSIQPEAGAVPTWTLADRLRKAREHAGLKQSELAGRIGIARSSVVNYEAGRYVPSRPVVLSWALCAGVDYKWLAGNPDTGNASPVYLDTNTLARTDLLAAA